MRRPQDRWVCGIGGGHRRGWPRRDAPRPDSSPARYGHYCTPATIFWTMVKISCTSSAWSGSHMVKLLQLVLTAEMMTTPVIALLAPPLAMGGPIQPTDGGY
jgi:hypothetical protein